MQTGVNAKLGTLVDSLTASDWVLATAALVGPILAVVATRIVDALRDNRARKDAVFVSLMTTRRAQLTAEHVSAINRVELEFANSERVISELRRYMELMHEKVPPLSRFEKDEDVRKAWKESDDDLVRRRRRAFGALVQAIGQKLGRRVDRHDIIEGGYYPGGWAEAEVLQLENIRAINDILHWRNQLPVHLWRVSPPVPLEGVARVNSAAPGGTGGAGIQGPAPGEPGSPFPPPPV